jgi:RimJ/RimL family protein N-acetyltransferase
MELIYFRALEPGDLERTYQWHNDPNLYKTLGGVFHYVSRTTEEEWLRQMAAFSNREINLAVCLTENSQHIGNIYLRNIDWVARHGEVHLFIGEAGERLKGYGQAATRLLARYAFRDLGLLRLYCFIIGDNQPSIKMFEKCGWMVEGKLRNHTFKDGHFKDVLAMGICASDIPSESNKTGRDR